MGICGLIGTGLRDTERRHNEEFCLWWEEARIYNLQPPEAQRAWLDKAIELEAEYTLTKMG